MERSDPRFGCNEPEWGCPDCGRVDCGGCDDEDEAEDVETFWDADTKERVSVRCGKCGETRTEEITREALALYYRMEPDGIYVSTIDPTYECLKCWLEC